MMEWYTIVSVNILFLNLTTKLMFFTPKILDVARKPLTVV